MLVSVIVPIYNSGKFLEQTIQSVLNQSFKDIELLLVDDGSTDCSLSICEKFAKDDNRITLISQSNSGVSVARNNGLRNAQGEYVYFLDSDDTIDSEFIRTSYYIAKQNDSDIVIVGEYYCRRMPKVMALPTCAQFLKLDFLKKYPGIKFPENIQPCEDGLFSHQLLAITEKIGLNPLSIYHYREHEDQNHLVINRNTEKVLLKIPEWFQILEKFYTDYDLFKSHSLHLALFMEHEPFEFRYLAMPLNLEQKVFLHTIIKDFMNKNVFTHLIKEDEKYLSPAFLYFNKTDNVVAFDSYYQKYIAERENKRRLYLRLINFIPIRRLRKKLRKTVAENFEK